ncbi:MAG: hypothetical protein IKA79_09280 [Lentisphaeria bacterium]|nr:hypothetical protein [Lentisphaeria bacterium]
MMPNYDKLFTRRSKFYSANIHIWKKIYAAYCGGSKYIKTALIPHVAENKLEFSERANRAIYLNIPRKITDMVTEYLFRSEPDRTNARKDISLDFDRNGMSVNLLMQQAQIINFLFGIAWILVDYPQVSGRIDLEGKQKGRIRPFARVLLPHNVKDWAFGNDGKLLWVLIEEHFEKKDDPFADPVDGIRIRLWTRTDWQLFEKVNSEIKLIAKGIHNLGEVPVIRWVNPNGYKLCNTHFFEDIVRISDAILNEISEAQMNTIKQMFGLLVVSQTFAECGGAPMVNTEIRDGETAEQAAIRQEREKETYRFTLSRMSSIFESAEEKGLTRYISPSGTETASIISFIQFLQNALNDVLRMALQSNSKTAQTAESKAWDNHNAQQFFAERAARLEEIEKRIWELMHQWDTSVSVPQISYAKEFSISDLSTMVNCLMDLSSFDVSEEFSREVCSKALMLLDKLDRIPQERYKLIEDGIRNKKFDLIPQMKINVDGSINSKSAIKSTEQTGKENETE